MINYSVIDVKSQFVMPYEFIGSTVRGALGVALKKVVCINPSFECTGCFAKENCTFYDFYESDFAKFRLKISLSPKLDFKIILFEEKIKEAPFIISAVYKALKETGITKNRIKIDNFVILYNNQLVYDGEFKKFDNKPFEFEVNDYKKDFTLKINTPIRIKQNGRFVKNDLSLETLLRSINHRFLKLTNREIQKLPFTPKYEEVYKNLYFKELTRFSNRQKTKMNLGGVMGEIIYKNVDENSYKMLRLGEIIGVGKQVTFGLGDIKVE